MRKTTWLIDQIALCIELIRRGGVCNLRAAVLLLDNVAEILMRRMAQDELKFNDLYERILSKAQRELDAAKFAQFCREIAREAVFPKLLTQQEKRKIDRYFPEKLKFLSEAKKHIPAPAATALLSLHDHRNEMYHRDTLRLDLLDAMAKLFFEIDCDLLQSLQNGSSYDSRDDWSEFFTRYGIKKTSFMLDQTDIALIVANWKREVSLDTGVLRECLKTYSSCRLTDANDDIVFLQGFFHHPSRQATINFLIAEVVPDLDHPKYPDLAVLDRIVTGIEQMNAINSKIDLFNHFSKIEQDFRPFESIISEGRSRVEGAIDMQVDLALGK